MAEVINLADVRRRELSQRSGETIADAVEIFPGVSLADLWRAWARTEPTTYDESKPEMVVLTRRG